MNTKQKGRRTEMEAKKLVESWGYSVELVKPSNKFGSVDFFGEFDIIAIKKPRTVSEYQTILFVQVKTNTTGGAIKSIKNWKSQHDTQYIDCLVMVKKNINNKVNWEIKLV